MKKTKVARAPVFTKNASSAPLVQGYAPSGWTELCLQRERMQGQVPVQGEVI